jgi:hypothetical protein
MHFTEDELKLIEEALDHYDAYLISQERESDAVQALLRRGSARREVMKDKHAQLRRRQMLVTRITATTAACCCDRVEDPIDP